MTDTTPSKEDIGAAMMAWYAQAIKQFPGGLVTQAQAAHMLGISRMAVSRLVSRKYLGVVYFPREPEVLEIPIMREDPTWLKLVGWFGTSIGQKGWLFPTACYVSFADVCTLWKDGNLQKKCKMNWSAVFKGIAEESDSKEGRKVKEEKGGER